MSAPLAEDGGSPAGPPVALFDHAGLATNSPFTTTYDVSPDGETFVLVDTLELPKGAPTGSAARVVENWRAELSGGR
ncbi:MAG: hypothetical protein R2748_05670 [Bryobacterales bacterium]